MRQKSPEIWGLGNSVTCDADYAESALLKEVMAVLFESLLELRSALRTSNIEIRSEITIVKLCVLQ